MMYYTKHLLAGVSMCGNLLCRHFFLLTFYKPLVFNCIIEFQEKVSKKMSKQINNTLQMVKTIQKIPA